MYSLNKKKCKVCSILSNFGKSIHFPSQSTISKKSLNDNKKIDEKTKIQVEKKHQFSLHFELIIIGSQNEDKTVKLTCKFCKKGSAAEIYEQITIVLDEFNSWNKIRMIICDTTAVNSGQKSSVVMILQEEFKKRNLSLPQYIGWQYHIFDQIQQFFNDLFLY